MQTLPASETGPLQITMPGAQLSGFGDRNATAMREESVKIRREGIS